MLAFDTPNTQGQARKSQSIKAPLISLLYSNRHAHKESKRAKSVKKKKKGARSCLTFVFFVSLFNICQFKMVNPSKKRLNEYTYDGLRKKNGKSKMPRVTVKEEFNTEIQLTEPASPTTTAEGPTVEVIPQESVISTQSSGSMDSILTVQNAASNQLVIRDENLPPLPPVSSLLLFTPGVEANKFDPFYQSVNSYVQSVLPKSNFPQKKVKREDGQAPPVMRQTMEPNALPLMPMIPYYFHHKQFGIEACMCQLQQQRENTGTVIRYDHNVPSGTTHYYYI